MRAFLFLLLCIAGVCLTFALSGCAPAPRLLEGSGIEAPAPSGYLEHCRREPDSLACPKNHANPRIN
jgi:hypothetical protein